MNKLTQEIQNMMIGRRGSQVEGCNTAKVREARRILLETYQRCAVLKGAVKSTRFKTPIYNNTTIETINIMVPTVWLTAEPIVIALFMVLRGTDAAECVDIYFSGQFTTVDWDKEYRKGSSPMGINRDGYM
jgi:hypothetical protein